MTYFLDGAHTTDSVVHAFNWYRKAAEAERSTGDEHQYKTALVFNKTSNRLQLVIEAVSMSIIKLNFHNFTRLEFFATLDYHNFFIIHVDVDAASL